MPAWFAEALARLGTEPALQATLAALSTFILEDPTTVGCGLLVADGRMALLTAMIGVSAGIAVGDVGLYALGRWAGPTVVRRGWLSPARLQRVAPWFRHNLLYVMILSRFVPGMRLPTYVGAGIVGARLSHFVALAVGASICWTGLILWLTVKIGKTVLPLLGQLRWPVAIVAVLLLVLIQRRAARSLESAEDAPGGGERVVSRFEFWSPWLFYVPVALYYVWLAVRFRGTMLPTVANPSIFSGGLIGESKSQILDLVSPAHRHWIAPYVVFPAVAAGSRSPREALAAAKRSISAAGLCYPLVAKPDVGQRGAGVRPIRGDADLASYLGDFPAGGRILFQRLVGSEPAADLEQPERHRSVREAGVFYWRCPGDPRGSIFSITLKQLPEVVGDGRRTVRELIETDPRARRVAQVYLKRLADRADEVLGAGQVLPLVFAGNHCQGAVFKNGTDLATPALFERIDSISRAMPEFYVGRFDIRFAKLQALLEGREFQIIEINGAGAEATHIWDASARLRDAYSTLFQQFRILFTIGAANRRRGHRPLSVARFLREAVAYWRLSRSYPLTH